MDTDGLVIVDVSPGSPALRAGIAPRSILVSVNGQEVRTPRDLDRVVANIDRGDAVSVVIREPAQDGLERIVNYRTR